MKNINTLNSWPLLNSFFLIDIDECNIMNGVCGEAGDCHNIPGSFECRCPSGYESHPTMRTCIGMYEYAYVQNLCT